MTLDEYKRGYRDGIRFAVTWLHSEAKRMDDPHAEGLLNGAGFGLGNVTSSAVNAAQRQRHQAEDSGNADFTRTQKRVSILRELAMRRRVYPIWVQVRKMTKAEADHEIAVMEAILADYLEPDLFGGKNEANL